MNIQVLEGLQSLVGAITDSDFAEDFAEELEEARAIIGRASMKVQSIDPPAYAAETDDAIIARALAILQGRVKTGPIFDSPARLREYLRLYFAEHSQAGREAFAVIFLDSQHRLIRAETLFLGTLSQTSVYPREVIKAALACNSAAVVFAHNHPSGSAEPSRADEYLTQTLKAALQLVDVRTLDHFVVGGDSVTSFAERGLI